MEGLRSIVVVLMFFLISLSIGGFSQEWRREIVEEEVLNPFPVTGDLDRDGDEDIVTMDGEAVICYENLLAWGWRRHVVDPDFPGVTKGSIDVLDLDSDEDLDLVINSWTEPGVLVWYENVWEGWDKHIIVQTQSILANRFSSFGDMDNDADVDIVTCTKDEEGRVLLYENREEGWQEHEIASLNGPGSWSTISDVNGDRNLDIVVGTVEGDIILLLHRESKDYVQVIINDYEKIPIARLRGSEKGLCADIDGDSDVDILTHSSILNLVVYYENPRWNQRIISDNVPDGIPQPRIGDVGDIDKDGDLDLSYGATNEMGWFENDPKAGEWQRHIIDFSRASLAPTVVRDMDLDSDLDIVAFKFNDPIEVGDVRIYKNQLEGPISDVQDLIASDSKLPSNYPNPFNPTTTIAFELPRTEQVSLEIYNSIGQRVTTLVSKQLPAGRYHYSWDASGFASGIYIYRLEAGQFKQTRKMLLIR